MKIEEKWHYEPDNLIGIQQSAWENKPVWKIKLKGNNYPVEIRQSIIEKRRARRKWHQSIDRRDKKNWTLINLTQGVRRKIVEFTNNLLKVYLQSITNDKHSDYSLWKATKTSKRPIMQIHCIKLANGKWTKEG